MPTSKPRRPKSYRPGQETLEGRMMLSGVVQGVDVDGDLYTLSLSGPGAIRVLNQPGADGTTPIPIGQAGLINTITLQGTNPTASRLVGAVQQASGGDGRVFFENLVSPSNVSTGGGIGVGILSIEMPDFWLGDTSPGDTDAVQGTIRLPNGINTLNFGGVDTTAFFGTDDADRLDQNGISNQFNINLGFPTRIGTSVIVDRIVTANQAAVDGEDGASATQDTVTINVAGRLNAFQANQIDGDETLDLGETGVFDGNNVGGTTINSGSPAGAAGGNITGAIGRFRVGGAATNLAVNVTGTQGRLTSFFIGGETNKVSVSATFGVRDAKFGLGMDTVSIQGDEIQQIEANRGAVGSSVLSATTIGRITVGGDVSNSSFLAGYSPATAPGADPTAISGGQLTTLIAGDVFDSVIAASVQPFQGAFGGPNAIVLPSGYINAKVEGAIDNGLNPSVDPDAADQAFFADRVRLEQGPIVPPGAPSGPYRPQLGPGRTPGVRGESGGPRNELFQFIQRRNARRAGG